ncbi:protein unc-13 homolog A-like isoform X2 [Dysidea avara]|uniref:protein unc-13 homolog A-like isoform X2 n=1 Tax=Dysidea avara TaxID=196820 RepID=UPI00333191F1
MPLLRVFVTSLKIAPDSLSKAGNYFILLRVGFCYTRNKTIKLAKSSSEQEISWDDELCINVRTLKSCLSIELHREKMFSQSQELASLQIPLCYINHSSQRAESKWYHLETTDDSIFQILMDVRFDLPPDMTSDEKDVLDDKLQQLNRILEREVKVLEEQSKKLASGTLAPPLMNKTEDTDNVLDKISYYDAAEESCSVTSAESKEDICISSMTRKSAQEQWQKIRNSVPALLRMKKEMKKETGVSVDSITGQQTTRGSDMIDTAAQQKLSQMKCFQNIDQKFEKMPLDSSAPPKRITSLKYGRSYSTIIREPRLTGLNDQLKNLVYQKTLQALIYPASDPNAHQFETWSAKKPTKCSECGTFLLGIARQGVKCRACGRKCHKRCATLVNADCPMATTHHCQSIHAEEHAKGICSLSLLAISNKMKRTSINSSSLFTLLREAFGVSDKEHVQIQNEVESVILDSVTNFNAVIKVKIVSVHNLRLKEEGLNPAVYVSVSVAHVKRTTSTYKGKEDPAWDEEFSFDCHNSLDKIKIRVWNKATSPLAKLSHKLTKESDYFLGQKVVEARMLGCPMDVWYKLDKRTSGDEVTGYIHLNISCEVEGETNLEPYYVQYTCLHSHLFNHMHLAEQRPLVPMDNCEASSWDVLLPEMAQDIDQEFALRYGIEPIYRIMTHFACLVQHYALPGGLEIMADLLVQIKWHMLSQEKKQETLQRGITMEGKRKSRSVVQEDLFVTNNYGGPRFSKVLSQLLCSLRIDLQSYPEIFPADDHQKLSALSDCVRLISTIVDFKLKVLGEYSESTSDLVQKSVQQSMGSTYDLLIDNCIEEGKDVTKTPSDNAFEFSYNLISQLMVVLYHDHHVYPSCLARHCSFNLGNISSETYYNLFSETLQKVLEGPPPDDNHTTTDYINLLFAVKNLYDTYVQKIPKFANQTPTYPSWFEPHMMRWFEEYEENSLTFVENAVKSDKLEGFAKYGDQPYSVSVFDVFCNLHQGYELVKRLHCLDMQLCANYLHRYAQVVHVVICHYMKQIEMELLNKEGTSIAVLCVLLNNIQITRLNLQSLYHEMGGESAIAASCKGVLQNLQSGTLANVLSTQCEQLAHSFIPFIAKEVHSICNEVAKLKGDDPVKRETVHTIVEQLMDELSKRSQVMLMCLPVVLHKVAKEMWMITMDIFLNMILRPLVTETMHYLNKHLTAFSGTTKHHFTAKQCEALEIALDVIKAFFLSYEEINLKSSILEKLITKTVHVISLFRLQTTELIKMFLIEGSKQSPHTPMETRGTLNIETHLKHIGQGKSILKINVVSLQDLKVQSAGNAIRPSIELTVIGPTAPGARKKFVATNSSKSNLLFTFNQTFEVVVGEDQMDNDDFTELQVTVKNHVVFGGDKLLSVAIVKFSTLLEGEHELEVKLFNMLKFSKKNWAILSVLAKRNHDEMAKEFVSLKSQTHTSVGTK